MTTENRVENKMEERWGERLCKNREGTIDFIAETAVLSIILATYAAPVMDHLKEVAYNALHTKDAFGEMFTGTLGEQAANSVDVPRQFEPCMTQLRQQYDSNETISREASRIEISVKGAFKEFFETGNELKPIWWKRLDDGIVDGYGKVMKTLGNEAVADASDGQFVSMYRQGSQRLERLYEKSQSFAEARQQNEETVRDFIEYLGDAKATAIEENTQMAGLCPQLVQRVKEGYQTENRLLYADGRGVGMSDGDLRKVQEGVNRFASDVQDTRVDVSEEIPLSGHAVPYIDIAMNPLVLAVAGVALLKGVRRTFLPKAIDEGIANVVTVPVRYGINAVHDLHEYIRDKQKNNQKDKQENNQKDKRKGDTHGTA